MGVLMEKFKSDFLLRNPRQGQGEPKPVVIAVLDTGFGFDQDDSLIAGGRNKIVQKDSRDYTGDNEPGGWNEETWKNDNNGHGTHVVRILLHCTVNSRVIVLKVFEGETFKSTVPGLKRVAEASSDAKYYTIINLARE